MHSKIVAIPTGNICGWPSFHGVSKEIPGFPEFYGHNLNA
jgi:hypothetical protein